MRKLISLLLAVNLLISLGCAGKGPVESTISKDSTDEIYKITMKRDLFCLMMAYPEYIKGIEQSSNGSVYAITKSGGKILYDDRRTKGLEEKQANADLQDTLEQPYPLYGIKTLMPENFDPGRARSYALLKLVYGGSMEEVQSNLTNVRAGGRMCQFNKSNRASEALKTAMKEVAERGGAAAGAAFPINGTFNYRTISGTNRLSPHAFGIAIDLKSDKRDYWKWASRKQGEQRLSTYPADLVQIFENNNFIWGGKWGHFDILHFEYRPEIILKARYFSGQADTQKPWYDGAPSDNVEVKSYITYIDQTIK